MTNPTSNYSFQMPTATDLVTDLPADFEVFGQAVDTRLKALQPGTTLGDLAYSSATANTNTRLPIGTTGQVLSVSGGVPTWTTPAGAGTAFVNISTTTVNTGTSYTISGLSGYDKLRIFVQNVSQTGTSSPFLRFQLNGDTGSNYNYYGAEIAGGTTDDYAGSQNSSNIDFARQSTTASDSVKGYIFIDGCNGTDDKIGHLISGCSGTTSKRSFRYGFRYNASAAISSITFFWTSGDFDGGTIDIWGSAN